MSEPKLSVEVAKFGIDFESGERREIEARDYLWQELPPKIAALEEKNEHLLDVFKRAENRYIKLQIRNSDLLDKLHAARQLRIEVENTIGMAHSFANFPSWLEQLEKALATTEEE